MRGLGLAAALVFGATRAEAQAGERAPVSIAAAGCGDLPVARVRDLVGIELDVLDPNAPADADTTRVDVTCDGTRATIEVVDPVTGKSLTRRIDLGIGPPAASARLLALAIVELVSASWVELVGDAPPAAPRVDATASEPTRRAAARTVRTRLAAASFPSRARIVLEGAGLLEGRPAFVAPGVGISFEHDFARHFGWGADVVAAQTSVGTSLGDVRVARVSTALVLLARTDLEGLSLEAGPGARVGLARLEGLPTQGGEGRSLLAPWAGALATGRIVLFAPRGVVATLGAEVGWVTLSVGGRVAGARAIALEGAWVGATLGIGLSFGDREPVSPIPPT